MNAGSSLEGRALSTGGAVGVDNVTAGLPVCGTLATTLIAFKATQTAGSIYVNWIGENESSFAGYDLQRSADGYYFVNIVHVPAGNTGYTNSYQWIDTDPLASIRFYRLKMIDLDGSFKCSEVIHINKNKGRPLVIYPNPVATGNSLHLKMMGWPEGICTISLYNSFGNRIMSKNIVHNKNQHLNNVVLGGNMPAGVYFLEINDMSGQKQICKVFIQ